MKNVYAAVVKLADALDSKSSGLILRVGSSPTSGTNKKEPKYMGSFLLFAFWVGPNRRFVRL